MELPHALNQYLAPLHLPYAVCGGWAIDLYLGYASRPHKDLDVTIFWQDRDRVVQHMLGDAWAVYEPCGTGYLHKINHVGDQMRIKSNLWCVREGNPHYHFTRHEGDMYTAQFDGSEQTELDFIEFLCNRQSDGNFLYARNHAVVRPMHQAIRTAGAIPYLAPEIVLLYKSTACNQPEYQHDFAHTVPKLNREQHNWLYDALSTMYPDGHPWLIALKIK